MSELAVIIPTYNESLNVVPLFRAVSSVLQGVDFELIFVDDDSPDGTSSHVLDLARTDPRVRLLHRIHRRGLASAVVEGMMASSAPYLVIMDGDLQHDEALLPKMLRRLQTGNVDIVIGTRNCEGGSMGEFCPRRVALSEWGRRLSAFVCRTNVSDPMSGYFGLRRDFLDEVVRDLSCVGFKILVDLLASSKRTVRIEEIGYSFGERLRGDSKLDLVVGLEYAELLLDKLVGRWIPIRYVLFGMVGAVGVVAQLLLMRLLLDFGGLKFDIAQITSSLLVIASNYIGNNRITFRSRRRRGWAWVWGLVLFAFACSLGLYLNLRVSSGLFAMGVGWALASLAGILIASVWNYSMGGILVWRRNQRRA